MLKKKYQIILLYSNWIYFVSDFVFFFLLKDTYDFHQLIRITDQYFFKEILELVDFDLHPPNVEEDEKTCPIFHFMPRFVRDLPGKSRSILVDKCLSKICFNI